MNQYRRLASEIALEIGEIAQCKLEVVHAIDEGQIHRQIAHHNAQVASGKKCIAGFGEYPVVCRQRKDEFWVRIDADRLSRRCGEPERITLKNADFDVGTRLQLSVNPLENLKIIFTAKNDLSLQPTWLGERGRNLARELAVLERGAVIAEHVVCQRDFVQAWGIVRGQGRRSH